MLASMFDFSAADPWLALGAWGLLVIACLGMVGLSYARDYFRVRRAKRPL